MVQLNQDIVQIKSLLQKRYTYMLFEGIEEEIKTTKKIAEIYVCLEAEILAYFSFESRSIWALTLRLSRLG